MRDLADVHDEHDATWTDRGGPRVVAEYGRPARAHTAVRNGVGVTERPVGVVTVEGADRYEFVDNAVSNAVPAADGQGVYALLLDPQGRVETECYVFTTDERLLVLTPPERAAPLADDWTEKTFIQDVTVSDASADFAVFGVYGPKATEKVASVTPAQTPATPLSFVRASMGDAGVTVVRDDGLTGEEGYLVVSGADAAVDVFDTLENRGLNAAPFGLSTWHSLTLEAGTPLFETELDGRIPNQLGLRNAIDFEKGCFVGQEVLSRIENRGELNRRLVGLTVEDVPDAGATVSLDGDAVGEVTRALVSPTREEPIALALVDADGIEEGAFTVEDESAEHGAAHADLPFVEGSERSARLPTY